MSAMQEKNNFGASVVESHLKRPTPNHLHTSQSAVSEFSSLDSPMTPAGLDNDPANPFSNSRDASIRPSTEYNNGSKAHLDVYGNDLEAGGLSTTTTIQPKISVDGRLKEARAMTMWPSKQSLIAENKAHKKARRCGGKDPMRNLNKKQKLTCKILIALLIVAIAVGLGVGISRAVGGGIWAGDGKSRYIPNGQE